MAKKLTKQEVINKYKDMLGSARTMEDLASRAQEVIEMWGDCELKFGGDGLYYKLGSDMWTPILYTHETHGNLNEWIQQTKRHGTDDD